LDGERWEVKVEREVEPDVAVRRAEDVRDVEGVDVAA
jgi:hypothetical protein